jgi:hypothetical protein
MTPCAASATPRAPYLGTLNFRRSLPGNAPYPGPSPLNFRGRCPRNGLQNFRACRQVFRQDGQDGPGLCQAVSSWLDENPGAEIPAFSRIRIHDATFDVATRHVVLCYMCVPYDKRECARLKSDVLSGRQKSTTWLQTMTKWSMRCCKYTPFS